MPQHKLNVLFLCTHNSARSLLAEGLLNSIGKARFSAYSAGSMPSGRPNPLAVEKLVQLGIDTAGMRSKSWDEFAQPGAPAMDLVITVCDDAAGEVCPVWPGHPATAHWGIADPSAVRGSEGERRAAFSRTAEVLKRRIEALVNLPVEQLDRPTLQEKARTIGDQ